MYEQSRLQVQAARLYVCGLCRFTSAAIFTRDEKIKVKAIPRDVVENQHPARDSGEISERKVCLQRTGCYR